MLLKISFNIAITSSDKYTCTCHSKLLKRFQNPKLTTARSISLMKENNGNEISISTPCSRTILCSK